jgi:hypothetical protein
MPDPRDVLDDLMHEGVDVFLI